MRIFACSDFHGARVIMDKLPQIRDKADLVLLCGDICGKKIGQPTDNLPEFQRNNLVYVRSVLNGANIPFRFILGNDDWIEDDSPERLTGPEEIEGYTFCPLEFVPINRKKTNRETDDSVIASILKDFPCGEKTVIVAHTPPFGCCDLSHTGKHCGSSAARGWIEEKQPLVWFCGHIHEDYSSSVIGKTRVFNSAVWLWGASLRGWLFDTQTGKAESVLIE